MRFVLFHDQFPDLAERETRTIKVLQETPGSLPPGEYGLCEMFCSQPDCDCRRVMFYVVEESRNPPVAVVNFGWESKKYYERWLGSRDPAMITELKGPSLNMGSPQSELAPAILRMIRDFVLPDRDFVERVKRHYRMFRDRIDGKDAASGDRSDPVDERESSIRKGERRGRNSACPCGSGKKFKRCCGMCGS